jgi:hypothetical protein
MTDEMMMMMRYSLNIPRIIQNKYIYINLSYTNKNSGIKAERIRSYVIGKRDGELLWGFPQSQVVGIPIRTV